MKRFSLLTSSSVPVRARGSASDANDHGLHAQKEAGSCETRSKKWARHPKVLPLSPSPPLPLFPPSLPPLFAPRSFPPPSLFLPLSLPPALSSSPLLLPFSERSQNSGRWARPGYSAGCSGLCGEHPRRVGATLWGICRGTPRILGKLSCGILSVMLGEILCGAPGMLGATRTSLFPGCSAYLSAGFCSGFSGRGVGAGQEHSAHRTGDERNTAGEEDSYNATLRAGKKQPTNPPALSSQLSSQLSSSPASQPINHTHATPHTHKRDDVISLRPVDIADFTSNFHDTAEANAPNISRTRGLWLQVLGESWGNCGLP